MKKAISLFLLLASFDVLADLPLNVEEVMTEKGRFRFDFSSIYSSSVSSRVFSGDPVVIYTGPRNYVTLPGSFGEKDVHRSTLVSSLGLRYGFKNKSEIYFRVGHVHDTEVESGSRIVKSKSESYFSDAWVGFNKKVDSDKGVGFLFFGEIPLFERRLGSRDYLKSVVLGFTVYKPVDPVVFSATLAYRLNHGSIGLGSDMIKQGNSVFLTPAISFAVNDRVSLTSGINFSSKERDKRFNGEGLGVRNNRLLISLGAIYGFSKGTSLSVTYRGLSSDNSGSDVRAQFSYSF